MPSLVQFVVIPIAFLDAQSTRCVWCVLYVDETCGCVKLLTFYIKVGLEWGASLQIAFVLFAV